MRFALIGNHPDGIDLARALSESRHHSATAPTGDLEEILADPAVEAVIVAGLGERAAALRRALQSEHHVLCVHPSDGTPDAAYEAAMIQGDTGQVLLPMLPGALHPGVVRLGELTRAVDSPLGAVQLIDLEIHAAERILIDTDPGGHKASLPGWDVLRAVGGEVAEVAAFAVHEEVDAVQPLLVSGSFAGGGLFRAAYLPGQAAYRWRLTVVGSRSTAALAFADHLHGPARLTWRDETDQAREEAWPAWDPWPALIDIFDKAVAARLTADANSEGIDKTLLPAPLSWQDEVRCLELDAAARRGVHYRRSVALEYQDANEEVGFKGTMTLVGCALLWGLLGLLVVSVWEPRLFWGIIPLLAIFLVLQMLRWVIPPGRGT